MVKLIWKATKAQRVAINMATCAFLLWPFGTKPRETISGFLGRKSLEGSLWAANLAVVVDWLCRDEFAHCFETALQEYEARAKLGYEP